MGIQLTSFRPEQHGFRFANSFTSVVYPPIPFSPGLPLDGLCGGMSFAALDYFFAGTPVPTHTTADYTGSAGVPPNGSRLWELILKRHINSVGLTDGPIGVPITVGPLQLRLAPGDLYNPKRFLFFEVSDQPTVQAALANEVSNLPNALTTGPVPLILVAQDSITESHQVVAVGFDDTVTPTEISLYDCRYPNTTCVLRYDAANGTCTLDAPGLPTEPWKAFFVAHYNPVLPPYLDMQITNGPTANSAGSTSPVAYNVSFDVTNQGDAVAHATEIWPLMDPDPGGVPTQPVGDVPVGTTVSYSQTIVFPPNLSGATVTIQAVIGNQTSDQFGLLPPAAMSGVTNTTQITLP